MVLLLQQLQDLCYGGPPTLLVVFAEGGHHLPTFTLIFSGLEKSTRKSRFFPTENFPFARCREWQDRSDYRMKAEIAKSAATLREKEDEHA